MIFRLDGDMKVQDIASVSLQTIWKLTFKYRHAQLNHMDVDWLISLLRNPYDARSQFLLGEVYAERIYVGKPGSSNPYDPVLEPSDGKALEYYLRSAEQGYGKAMFRIGQMYEKGTHPRGMSTDRAMEWYLRGSDRGDPDSMYAVGRMYHLGNGVYQSYEKAMEWYRKAAELGHAEACNKIGKMYETGAYPEQSAEEAERWFARAAGNGYQKRKSVSIML